MKNTETARSTVEEMHAIQCQKLQECIAHVAEHSPFYRELFAKEGIVPSEILCPDDLSVLPTVSKDDLQERNMDFLCVPPRKVIDYVSTSGTLGDPVTIALSESDLDRLAHNESLSLACAGVDQDSLLQLMCTLDRRFMAGMAYFLGARKLGAGVIRIGAGIPELQWNTILKMRPSHLVVVPSFLLKLIRYAEANGIDLNNTSVKAAICIGEPIREQDFSWNVLAQRIQEAWPIDLYSTYASTEMSTAFTECDSFQGGHLQPDLIIAEILDEDGIKVPAGSVGELVITTLGVEAMPLIRFRTGDLVMAHDAPCSCGRNSMRLGPLVGRKQQMIKYKGTTLYPPSLENILAHFEAIDASVIRIDRDDNGLDEVSLLLQSKDESDEFLEAIKDSLRAKLRVLPQIEFVDRETMRGMTASSLGRKPVSVIDRRGE